MEAATVTCQGCGYVGPASMGFARIRRGLGTSLLCPGCQRAQLARGNPLSKLANIAFVGALLLMLLLLVGEGEWQTAALIVAVLAAMVLAVAALAVVHEAAHALVARLLRFRVHAISIGSGPVIGSGRVGSAAVTFRLVPFGGVTVTSSQIRRAYRVRSVAVYSAGVAVQALVIVAVLWWSPREPPWSVLAVWLVFANAIDIVVNLWPRRVMTTAGPSYTDGGLIWRALRMTDAEVDAHMEGAAAMAAFEAKPPADELAAEHLADAPAPVRMVGAAELIHAGRATEAVPVLDRLLAEDTGDDPPHSMMLANNLAYALVLSGTRLNDADRLSARAFALAPWEPAVQGTRGSVLVELQRADEAVPLLEQSLAGVTRPEVRAEVEGYLALAALQRGDRFTARKHLTAMKKVAPACPLRPRVAQALAEADAASPLEP